MLLTAFDGWAAELMSAVVGGVIAGMVAWLLLRKTQKGEAAARAIDRREAAARALIPAIRNTVDLATTGRKALEGTFQLWELRNQIALAEGPLRGASGLAEVREFYEALVELRKWVRSDPDTGSSRLGNQGSPERRSWNQYGTWLNDWANRLVLVLHRTYDPAAPAPGRLAIRPSLAPRSSKTSEDHGSDGAI